jgi:hypothetical protein
MEAVAQLRRVARRVPLVRNLRHAPPYFTGPVTANRLGLQVLRVVGKYAIWRLRQRAVPLDIAPYVATLTRDGIVVLPDFLPKEEFDLVRAEFEQAAGDFEFYPVPRYGTNKAVERGRIHSSMFGLNERLTRFPKTKASLLANPLLHRIVSAAAHVRSTTLPSATIDVYRLGDETAPDNDVETVLHADLHSPTIKAFFYLNDVDRTNGAFVYAKGSTALSLARLRHEYDMSIRVARLKRGGDGIDPKLLAVRGPNTRNVIRPEHAAAMNIVESPVCGRANTLIIANNMGFHRRGDFSSSTPRETILLNFRHLQRQFWS